MTEILWDGTSIYSSGNSIIPSPCPSCCGSGCTDPECEVPEYTCPTGNTIHAECTGLCSEESDIETCYDNLKTGLEDQNFTIDLEDSCCHCDDYVQHLFACCSGNITYDSEYVEYYPVGENCEFCSIVEGSAVSIIEYEGSDHWAIPLCGDPPPSGYYCIEEP